MTPTEAARPGAFRRPWWARGPHTQTLFARVLRSPEGPAFARERLDTDDGDFLDVDWTDDPGPDAPIVLVLHGLEGSSHRRYVRSVARKLLERGVRTAAMNFRGCSGEPNRALRFYHSGETSDPSAVLDVIRSRYPDRRLGAMGFSLGGNVVLKMMGERDDGGAGLVDACAAMSVPYDLDAGCAFLEGSTMGRGYSAYFLRSLRRKVASKRELLGTALDLAAIDAARTIREFDDVLTAPLNGFESASDYYARCSSAGFLDTIRVPTLLLHARNDPFLPADAIPEDTVAANPHLHMRLEEYGGHVGFVDGSVGRPRFWGEESIADFLAEALLKPR